MQAQDLAQAISEHFLVSVLVHGENSERLLSGRVVADTLDQAVESLSFLLGVRWRKQGENIYLVGGSKPEKVIRAFPSYGLTGAEVQPLAKEGGGLVAGRVIVESDEMRVAEVGGLLESFKARPSLTLELFVLSVAESSTDRVNDWLESFKVGASYFENSAVPYINPLSGIGGGIGGGLGGDYGRKRGLNYKVDISTLFELVPVGSDLRVELREQVQVLSGGQARFKSGDVVKEVSYTTVPGQVGSDQLVSRIDRRTVGLVVELQATEAEGDWFVRVNLEDSSLSGESERTTSYDGERFIRRDQVGYFLLGSFTRKSDYKGREGVRVVSGVPLLGSVLRRKSHVQENRSVMVLARSLGDTMVQSNGVSVNPFK